MEHNSIPSLTPSAQPARRASISRYRQHDRLIENGVGAPFRILLVTNRHRPQAVSIRKEGERQRKEGKRTEEEGKGRGEGRRKKNEKRRMKDADEARGLGRKKAATYQ